jgi:CofD-related protein of GAK system
MPAVGDLRNRILALADVSSPRSRALHDLLAHRLPPTGSPPSLLQTLMKVLRKLPPEAIDSAHACLAAVGPRFDLRHASVGNLVLAGMYLTEERSLQRAVERLSRLVGARGTVCPVSGDDLHLAAELGDGSVVVGQHRITAAGAAEPPIRRILLVRSLGDPTPVRSSAPAAALDLIRGADLVCFPMGSFFTSVVASLLPEGIGEAVAASPAPRVYLPNPGGDAEERGWSLEERVRGLAAHLGPLLASEIRVERGLRRSPWDRTRYDDAAVVEALAGMVGP